MSNEDVKKTNVMGDNDAFSGTGYLELDFDRIEQFEADVLLPIVAQLQGSEMSKDEQLFLNGVIRKARPQKIVEYGVAAGGSAAVILNAVKDIPSAKLYSLDYSKNYYRDPSKPVGWMIPERFSHLAEKWECFSGGICCQFLDQITNEGKDKIDLCLIDTVHSNPGEFLNLLEVLPYMKQNGIIIMHDTAMHTLGDAAAMTNCICLNTLHGKRIILSEDTSRKCPVVSNIGGLVLDANVAEVFYPLFTNLSLPWTYIIQKKDYDILLKHYQAHYSPELVSIFEKAYCHYKQQSVPLSIRIPFVQWYRDEFYHYFQFFGFTLKIKRGNKGFVRRLAEKYIGN